MTTSRWLLAVVDDDASVRNSLKRLLTSDGYLTETFASASALLDRYCGVPVVDCLIVDVNMPRIGGLELQQILLDAGLDTPVVFITGRADQHGAARALEAGAVAFLVKPFDDTALLKAVQVAIRRPRRDHAGRVSHWARTRDPVRGSV